MDIYIYCECICVFTLPLMLGIGIANTKDDTTGSTQHYKFLTTTERRNKFKIEETVFLTLELNDNSLWKVEMKAYNLDLGLGSSPPGWPDARQIEDSGDLQSAIARDVWLTIKDDIFRQ